MSKGYHVRSYMGEQAPDWATAISKFQGSYYWEESATQTDGARFQRVGGGGIPRIYSIGTVKGWDKMSLLKPLGETSPTYPVQPEPAHESDWSYAEAERLQKRAHEAIDAYNEYINAKPNTVFLTIFK